MSEPTALEALKELKASPRPWYSYNVTVNNVRDALIRDANNIVVARLNGDHFLNDSHYAALAVNSIDAAVAALQDAANSLDAVGAHVPAEKADATLAAIRKAATEAL